jgi:nitroimidazol reductase NimA-like FMN-containing flavoprotein (pyridoxamine 5'-phosphate oxidase superfamily)
VTERYRSFVTHPAAAPPRPFAAEPQRERPDSPPESYGVPRSGGEFVAWVHVVRRLTDAEGYWLATVTPSGRPHVVPIWGVMVDGELYLETGAPETVKNRNLERNRNIAVHLDGVTDTIIVRGTAEPTRPDHGTLGAALAAAFRAKYPGYEPEPNGWDDGGLYRVAPSSVLAWGDMPTATRWRWEREPA